MRVGAYWLANQFRLQLHMGAYWLLHSVRLAVPRKSRWRGATFEPICCMFVKIAMRVEEQKAGIKLRIPTQVGHSFRGKPATHSDGCRPPFPIESGHP